MHMKFASCNIRISKQILANIFNNSFLLTPLKHQFFRIHCSLSLFFNLSIEPSVELFELEIIEFVMLSSILVILSSQAERVLEKLVDIGKLSTDQNRDAQKDENEQALTLYGTSVSPQKRNLMEDCL